MGQNDGGDDRMNKDEFKQFFTYINAVTTDTNPNPAKTQVYFDALSDLPFDVAMLAAKKVIATLENPFLPMPAVFRGVAVEITSPKIPTAGEAYEEVLRAIRNFGGYREKEALESLSPVTLKAVKAVGWKSICYSEEPDIIRAQFRKAYEALEKRERTEAKVPSKLKALTDEILDAHQIEKSGRLRINGLTSEVTEKMYL